MIQPLLPHAIITNTQFICIFLVLIAIPYALLVLPILRTTRAKQIAVFPFLAALVILPLIYTCTLKVIHVVLGANFGLWVTTRMVDLYYVQPWTGIPSRYSLPAASVKPAKSNTRCIDAVTFLNWDMNRFIIEMWAPFRRISHRQPNSSDKGSSRMRWQDLLPDFILLGAILDITIFQLSFYTGADMLKMTLLKRIIFMYGGAMFIVGQLHGACRAAALIHTITTGKAIDTSEWAMLRNKLPFFAFTPEEFWQTWHTLLRYLWVDLGFLPMERFCERYLGPDRVNHRVAKILRVGLPVLAVFALSGIHHAYIVYAVWREPIWTQLFYFMTQGVAVVITKLVKKTKFGIKVRTASKSEDPMLRYFTRAAAILLMTLYHLWTAPTFIEPYRRHSIWLDLNPRSVTWWIYGKH